MNQLTWTGLIALAAVASSPAAAQSTQGATSSSGRGATSSEDSVGVADIVVTAQKRSEKAQDVPIAISVFTADMLRERAVGELSQLSSSTPNVSLDAGTPFSGSSAILAAYIRGIGANDFAINLDPGVGVYLDGVYLARTVGANLDLPDVARIEILKGPQGTLFGRNTIGGAISVVTRDPGDQFAFTGDVTTGRFHRLDVRGTVDVPITDGLAGLLTFSSKKREGYQKRIPFPGANDFQIDSDRQFLNSGYSAPDRSGDQDEWTLRGKLMWEPTTQLSVKLSGDYLRMDQAAQSASLLAVTSGVPGSFAGTNNIPGTALDPTGTTGFNFGGLYNFCIGATSGEIAARGAQSLCGPRGTPLQPALLQPGLASVNVDGNPANNRLPFDGRWVNTDKDTSYATGINFSRLVAWSLTGIVDYDLSDDLQLRSITGYRDLSWKAGTDLDNSPLNAIEDSFVIDQWQFSQEVQILGTALDRN